MNEMLMLFDFFYVTTEAGKGKSKGKDLPRTGHEGPEGK